jgi:hypothetical protein
MMQSTFPILSLAIWLPIVFGIVLALGRDSNPGWPLAGADRFAGRPGVTFR